MQALTRVNDVKKELKDISMMKQHASAVSKALKDVERLLQEISNLETDLEATGSIKTADDVQQELNDLSSQLLVISPMHSSVKLTRLQTNE
jgi:DNA repair protein RAD50